MRPETEREIQKVLQYLKQEDAEQAFKTCMLILETHLAPYDSAIELSQKLLASNYVEIVEPLLKIADVIDPDRHEHWMLRAELLDQINCKEEARTARCMARRKKRAWPFINAAQEAQAQKNSSEANKNLEQATRIDDKNYYAWLRYAQLLHESERYEEATIAWGRAHYLDPDAHIPLLQVSRSLFASGRESEALELLWQGVKKGNDKHPFLDRVYRQRSAKTVEYVNIKELNPTELANMIVIEKPSTLPIRDPENLNYHPNIPLAARPEEANTGLWVSQLNNVELVGDECAVLSNGRNVIYDPTLHPRFAQYSSECQTAATRDNKTILCLPKRDAIDVESGIVITGRAAWNYFHWVIEFLPRLTYADRIPGFEQSPIFVPEKPFPQLVESLKMIDPHQRPLLKLPSDAYVRVNRLLLPSLAAQTPEDTRSFPSTAHFAKPSAIQLLRSALGLDRLTRESSRKRLVYMQRPKKPKGRYRHVVNEDQIADFFESLGFERVDTGSMSFQQQVSLFSDCDVVVGAAGAAFANLAFMRPQTLAICLTNRFVGHPYLFSSISNAIDQRFASIFGEPIDEDKNHFSHFPEQDAYRIEMNDELKFSIEKAISSL